MALKTEEFCPFSPNKQDCIYSDGTTLFRCRLYKSFPVVNNATGESAVKDDCTFGWQLQVAMDCNHHAMGVQQSVESLRNETAAAKFKGAQVLMDVLSALPTQSLESGDSLQTLAGP